MTTSFRFSFEQFAHLLQGSLRHPPRIKAAHPVVSPANQSDASGYAVVDELADSELACGVLARAIPEARAGEWRLASFQIKKIQRQHRKRIVRGLMFYQKAEHSDIQTAEIIVKVYGSDRGNKALETLKQLWRAGFCSPAEYRVPRPYGYLPQDGALFQGMAPGTSWGDLLRSDDLFLEPGSRRAAAWLLRLQQCRLDGERKNSESAIEAVQRWAQELAVDFQGHAPRLESVSRQLVSALQVDDIRWVPSHGDYHPMNVFLTPTLTTVIDFDTFALREAAFDVGYAIGQLLIMSYIRTGAFSHGAKAALAFWQHYQKSNGPAPWDRVAVQIARTFLQSLHYELHTFHNNRLELLDLWTNQMEAWLDSGQRTIRDGLRALPLQMGPVDVR
jgi:hypothetical protein